MRRLIQKLISYFKNFFHNIYTQLITFLQLKKYVTEHSEVQVDIEERNLTPAEKSEPKKTCTSIVIMRNI